MQKVLSQRRWVRGLNATSPDVGGQLPGTIPRISNLLYDRRGGLKTCDGSLIVSSLNGAGPQSSKGTWTALQVYTPDNISYYYVGIQKDPNTHLGAPTGLAAADGGAGGTLTALTTFYYQVTAIDGAGGETPASAEVNFVEGAASHKVNLTWNAVTAAAGYNVYRTVTAGQETKLTKITVSTNAYTDDGSASNNYGTVAAAPTGAVKLTAAGVTPGQVQFTTTGAHGLLLGSAFQANAVTNAAFNATDFVITQVVSSTVVIATTSNAVTCNLAANTTSGTGFLRSLGPPVTDTTQVCLFYQIPATSYTSANILKTLPADAIPSDADPTGGKAPGGGTGGSGTTGGGGGGGSAAGGQAATGGITGNISPLPQLVRFTGKIVACLGNGFAPQIYDGTTVSAISNTFAVSYPTWLASTTQALNDVVTPTVANGHRYICVQAGKTGGAQPTWPTTAQKQIADGSVIWKEAGSDTSVGQPAGAAHGIVHAGALWVFNTSPTNTSDGLDGPSALRMSDINNPISWNPVNAAFIGKDDGTQGMGLASFTIAEAGIAPQGSLIVFKEFSTYQITGVFGSANFNIQQAQTDMGCIAPRSIQFLSGFGVVRLTHLGIAVFDGVRDRLISEEIRPYLFGGVSDITQLDWSFAYFCKAAQSVDPPMYLLAIPLQGNSGALTRLLCYDLVLKAWSIIDLPWSIGVLQQVRFSGSQPLTITGGWNDSTVRRIQANDVDWDGTPVSWSVRTPEVLGENPTDRVYFRRVIIRGIATGAANLTVTPQIVGTNQPAVAAQEFDFGSGEFYCDIDIGQTGMNANATITGTGIVELDSIDWHVMPKPQGALARAI